MATLNEFIELAHRTSKWLKNVNGAQKTIYIYMGQWIVIKLFVSDHNQFSHRISMEERWQ